MEVSSAFINKSHNTGSETPRKQPITWEPEPGSILDPFHIEDLLDFSNEDIAGPIGEEVSVVTTDKNSTQQHQPQQETALEQPAANEFPIDCDEIPELEWLSSFVDDGSFGMGVFIGNKGQSTGCYSPVSNTSDNKNPEEYTNKRTHRMMVLEESSSKDRFQVGSPISVLESASATSGGRPANQAVPGRPRSKRARNSANNTSWNNTSSSCLLNSTTNGISPATSSVSAEKEIVSENAGSGSGSDNSSFEQDVVDSVPVLREQESSIVSVSRMVNVAPPVKAGKPPLQGKPAAVATVNAAGNGEVQPRRCTHCLSQKTPQWRAGPEGPKTLCNACGVRYKSGRLFPEYRPALSPTFISEVHSNSHRKVLEMRRQKEMQQRQQANTSSSQEVIIDGGLIYTS